MVIEKDLCVTQMIKSVYQIPLFQYYLYLKEV